MTELIAVNAMARECSGWSQLESSIVNGQALPPYIFSSLDLAFLSHSALL